MRNKQNQKTANLILKNKRDVTLVIFKTNADKQNINHLNDADYFVDRLLQRGYRYTSGTKNYTFNSTPFCNFNYLGVIVDSEKIISHTMWDSSLFACPVALTCNIKKIKIFNDEM